MIDVKLLPCPFCGGEIKLDEDDFYMFCCDTCGAGITFAHELEDGTAEDCTKEESIESWNTRKPMERIVEQLEDISKVYCEENNQQEGILWLQDAVEMVKRGGADE